MIAEAFAAPGDPFWCCWGSVGFNVLIAASAATLGVYFLKAKNIKIRYVLPLSIVAALYGGYSLAVPITALGIFFLQKYQVGHGIAMMVGYACRSSGEAPSAATTGVLFASE